MARRTLLSVWLMLELVLTTAGLTFPVTGIAADDIPTPASDIQARSGPTDTTIVRTHQGSSVPAEDALNTPSRVIGAPPPGTLDCAAIWTNRDGSPYGVPRENTGLTWCLEYSNEHINGADFRVIYPAEWATESGGGWGQGFLEPAREAMRRSVEVFGPLGTMGSATLVFRLLEDVPGSDPRADTSLVEWEDRAPGEPPNDQACSIFVYPVSVTDSVEAFRQAIAHEMFHCFQAFTFPSVDIENPVANQWWVDGSATYFSNVAYPDVNLEYEWIDTFDSTSETTPITSMTYDATFFFQYLGNTIGDAEIIRLLGTLPVGGDEATQQAALRAFMDMDAMFQEFAQQYLDGELLDTNGAPIPFSPTFNTITRFNASGNVVAEIAPFTIRRREVVFELPLTYTLSIEETSGSSNHAFRTESGDWGDAPAQVDCDDPRTWRAVYTSVGEDGSALIPATLTATVTAQDGACEPTAEAADTCLIGKWSVADYDAFMQAALAAAGATEGAAPIIFEGSDGLLDIIFTADTITYAASGFELRGSTTVQGMQVMVIVRLEGTAIAQYDITTPGRVDLFEVDTTGFTVSAEIFVGGSSMGVQPIDPLDWIFFLSPSYEYACSDSRLDLMIPPLSVPVVLGRTD